MNLGCVDEARGGLVTNKGIIFPTVPERMDDLGKLLRAIIAGLMFKDVGQAEVSAGGGIGRCDSVPANATATGVV